jgi:hypothetical protein
MIHIGVIARHRIRPSAGPMMSSGWRPTHGGFSHASGVARELRNMMLSGRAPEQAFESVQWRYSEDAGPTGDPVTLKQMWAVSRGGLVLKVL